MKPKFRLKKNFAAIIIVASATLSLVWACGPWFPDWLLIQSDQEMLKAPSTHFRQELKRISQGAVSNYKTIDSEKEDAEQTLDAALLDLREALIEGAMSQSQMSRILKEHRIAREALLEYGKALEQWKTSSDPWLQQKIEPPSLDPPEVVIGLPSEFGLYFKGAIAFHHGDFAKARSFWLKVVELPESQRRYRSTWAEFMLGKLDVDTHPNRAIIRFRNVRSLVDQGFNDSLGLAASSLGWEARSNLKFNRYREAIELYIDQLKTGEVPSAYISIRWTLDRAFREGFASYGQLAHSSLIRNVVTAYLASRHGAPWGMHATDDIEHVHAWVSAVQAATAEKDPLFELLALTVYKRGLYELSERLLDQAPKDGLLSVWLRSKLLFRKGHVQEGMDLLTQVVEHFPTAQEMDDAFKTFHSEETNINDQNRLVYRTALSSPSNQPKGELGLYYLHRGEFIKAMDTLLRSGYWMDAAYVAERVLTVEELTEYVDQNWPVVTGNDPASNADGVRTLEETVCYRIRYLLARRLARGNRNQEAIAYYPPKWKEQHKLRIQNLKIGESKAQPLAERAKALWDAAKTTRYLGMELIGTELGPDWAIHDGNFELGVTMEARQSKDGNAILTPTSEELQRAAETRLEPFERFHYRLLAADIAWDALRWMPDNEVETARAFCEAGGWIKNIEPKAADRFYKALVKRCPKTEIGQAAEQLHWFPKLDEKGNLAIDKPEPLDRDSEDLKFKAL